jgi:internalin A
MTPEEAYEEALRRIRQAEETAALALDLSGLASNRLPRELGRLTSLQSLNLSWCSQLLDLSPLTTLATLRSLDLCACRQLRDLAPLANLSSLRMLDLSQGERLDSAGAP